jgi:hypothetical protein
MSGMERFFVIDFANTYEKAAKRFIPWTTVGTQEKVNLFTFQDFSNVLHFSSQTLENQVGVENRTLKNTASAAETINSADFLVRKISVALSRELEAYYQLTYLLVKDRAGNIKRYCPVRDETQKTYVIALQNSFLKLFTPIEDAFIFGIQFRFNDSCGVVMTEMKQSPQDANVFRVTLETVPLRDRVPTVSLPPGSFIKVNYFRNKIIIYDPETKKVLAELMFSKMKRNTFIKDDCTHTVYTYDITESNIYQAKLENDMVDDVFETIKIHHGSLDLLSVCCCACACNCNNFKIVSSRLYLTDNDFLKLHAQYTSIRLC